MRLINLPSNSLLIVPTLLLKLLELKTNKRQNVFYFIMVYLEPHFLALVEEHLSWLHFPEAPHFLAFD